jgi:Protein of unknown function (DUF402)
MTAFTEYKRTYFGETKVFNCTLVWQDPSRKELVVSYEPSSEVHFLGLEFPKGSLSYGYYWEDRNYNVYHWKQKNGETMLFYFNVSRDTRILPSSVTWLDLIVDIAVKDSNSPAQVLDEDEIPSSMSLSDLAIIKNVKGEVLSNLYSILRELESRTERFHTHPH